MNCVDSKRNYEQTVMSSANCLYTWVTTHMFRHVTIVVVLMKRET